jgi:NAD(P)-dependent dehydrogenase (short-subunit alcohol dehydrogenase family)
MNGRQRLKNKISIVTGSAQGIGRGIAAWVISQTPEGRTRQPEDIAPGAVYLASDEAAFVTGAELQIDGGYTAQ